jgi:enterochelin esterase-like enzyme
MNHFSRNHSVHAIFDPIRSKININQPIVKEITLDHFYKVERIKGVFSKLLNREVDINLLLPQDFKPDRKYALLLLNDGQDMEALKVQESLEKLVANKVIPEIIVAGVVAGDRLQEFGVAAQKDYLKRGSKAKAYTKYIVEELIPYLIYKYPVNRSKHVIAGCSMGALSAFDLAWNHPKVFDRVGAFSGAFWWRKRDSKSKLYSDARDRILHNEVKSGKKKEGMKFWFQTGTEDEASDRNKNGIIDSIDDTLDLIVELTKKGYRPFHDIQYKEVKGGRHSLETWAAVMPDFLVWAFGEK